MSRDQGDLFKVILFSIERFTLKTFLNSCLTQNCYFVYSSLCNEKYHNSHHYIITSCGKIRYILYVRSVLLAWEYQVKLNQTIVAMEKPFGKCYPIKYLLARSCFCWLEPGFLGPCTIHTCALCSVLKEYFSFSCSVLQMWVIFVECLFFGQILFRYLS